MGRPMSYPLWYTLLMIMKDTYTLTIAGKTARVLPHTDASLAALTREAHQNANAGICVIYTSDPNRWTLPWPSPEGAVLWAG